MGIHCSPAYLHTYLNEESEADMTLESLQGGDNHSKLTGPPLSGNCIQFSSLGTFTDIDLQVVFIATYREA